MKRVTDLTIGLVHQPLLLPATLDNGAYSAGDVNIIDIDTGLIASAVSEKVAFIKKCLTPAGVPFLEYSNTIHTKNITNYAPATLHVLAAPKVVTLGTITTPVEGTEYVMFIVSRENENYMLMRKRYSVVATAADVASGNGITIADKFRVLINADTTNTGVATDAAGAAVIVLTGTATQFSEAYQANFEVIPSNNLDYLTVTLTTAPDPGTGTSYTVGEMEKVAKGYSGVLNNVLFASQMYNVSYSVVAGTLYTIIAIEHDSPFHTNTEGSVPAKIVTQVAAIGAVTTPLDAIIAVL
jgi:hypothetical protein